MGADIEACEGWMKVEKDVATQSLEALIRAGILGRLAAGRF